LSSTLRVDAPLALLEERASGKRAASGLASAWLPAQAERPEMLAVEERYFYPAQVDGTGELLSPADDVEHPDVIDDAVDELIETVLRRGGLAALVEDGVIADHSRFVAPVVEPTVLLHVQARWWAIPTVFAFRLDVVVVALAVTELVLAVKTATVNRRRSARPSRGLKEDRTAGEPDGPLREVNITCRQNVGSTRPDTGGREVTVTAVAGTVTCDDGSSTKVRHRP